VRGTVTALDWAPDGRLAAVVDSSINVWRSLEDKEPFRLSTDARRPGALRWSPRGHLAAASDQFLSV
jgi:hypothetical protein